GHGLRKHLNFCATVLKARCWNARQAHALCSPAAPVNWSACSRLPRAFLISRCELAGHSRWKVCQSPHSVPISPRPWGFCTGVPEKDVLCSISIPVQIAVVEDFFASLTGFETASDAIYRPPDSPNASTRLRRTAAMTLNLTIPRQQHTDFSPRITVVGVG